MDGAKQSGTRSRQNTNCDRRLRCLPGPGEIECLDLGPPRFLGKTRRRILTSWHLKLPPTASQTNSVYPCRRLNTGLKKQPIWKELVAAPGRLSCPTSAAACHSVVLFNKCSQSIPSDSVNGNTLYTASQFAFCDFDCHSLTAWRLAAAWQQTTQSSVQQEEMSAFVQMNVSTCGLRSGGGCRTGATQQYPFHADP